jgi:nucleotide-binding universal stress UspA family protein
VKTSDARPIFCGTDFSEPAQHAANAAAALAKRIGTPLVLIHGADERGEIPRQYWPALIDEQRPHLVAEAARLRAVGAEVQEKFTGGVPEEGVAKDAEQAQARLIVLGSGGKGTFDRWVLGSAAERIAETAAVPTLVVRDAVPLEAWAGGERPLKVFVGADFTPSSDAALRWVAELRQLGPCEITLGFVDRAPEEHGQLAVYDAFDLTEESPEARTTNESDLRTKAKHYLGVEPGLLRVIPGSKQIDAHLLQLALEDGAELIVVGTHQWRGARRLRHGSVSRRILRNARTNVACIPSRGTAAGGNTHIAEVRRVLVATDLSAHGGRAIPHAYSVLGAGGAICLVHIAKPGEAREPILAQLRGMVTACGATDNFQTEVNVIENRDAAAGICEAADRFDADLICIGSHGRTGLLSVALGSVAQAVISQSSRPVLVVGPPRA